MYKFLLIIFLGWTQISCTHTPINIQPSIPSTIITCNNHQDKNLNFSYYPEDAQQWYSKEYKVNVYLIDTTNGEQIALNSLELQNYTCK